MSLIDQPIRYVIDSTALDIAVDVNNHKTDAGTQKSARPWLTICLEPISHTLLTFVLSLKLPGPEVIKLLLHQALQPSSDYPYGRRPDILQVDYAFLFAVLQSQGLFQKLQIAVERFPLQPQGIVERLFDALHL